MLYFYRFMMNELINILNDFVTGITKIIYLLKMVIITEWNIVLNVYKNQGLKKQYRATSYTQSDTVIFLNINNL